MTIWTWNGHLEYEILPDVEMYFGKGCRIRKSVYRGLTRWTLFSFLFYSSQRTRRNTKNIIILGIGVQYYAVLQYLFGFLEMIVAQISRTRRYSMRSDSLK